MQFAVEAGVLRFGEFKTKAGRLSPYFFNAGLFDDGAKLGPLAQFYARRLLASGLAFDMLFGPAYKGITLAAAVAIELARLGRNVPFAYNRKEAKDHGEGGTLVGAPLRGPGADRRRRDFGRHLGARVDRHDQGRRRHARAVAIALDRQEKSAENGVEQPWSAVQYVTRNSICAWSSIATLADLLQYLGSSGDAALEGIPTARVGLPRPLRRLKDCFRRH